MPTTLSQVGGPPARVTINLSILTMGPIDEDTQSFSLDCYFRQSWRDERLGYDAAGVSALALNWAFLEKIWCVCVSAFQLTYVCKRCRAMARSDRPAGCQRSFILPKSQISHY